jgi:rhodanese-related sulfurtransferase
MPVTIDRGEVEGLVRDGAQVVDVLSRTDYDELHIAGAISIPLKELDARTVRVLDASAPVVAYCNDFL